MTQNYGYIVYCKFYIYVDSRKRTLKNGWKVFPKIKFISELLIALGALLVVISSMITLLK